MGWKSLNSFLEQQVEEKFIQEEKKVYDKIRKGNRAHE